MFLGLGARIGFSSGDPRRVPEDAQALMPTIFIGVRSSKDTQKGDRMGEGLSGGRGRSESETESETEGEERGRTGKNVIKDGKKGERVRTWRGSSA